MSIELMEVSTQTSLVVLSERDIPAGMPLTNRLDKKNVEQARWAVHNGDAWVAYLKAQGGVISAGSSVTVAVSDTEKHKAIFDTLDRVWLDLTDNGKKQGVSDSDKAEWLDSLHWAVAVIPSGYERHCEIIQSELDCLVGVSSKN